MTSPSSASLRRTRGDEGFTLVEAMVAMMLVIVLATTVLTAAAATARLADQNRSRTVATELATREVATTRASVDAGKITADTLIGGKVEVDPTPIAGGSPGRDIVVAGTTYTVTRSISLAAGAEGRSLCVSGRTTLTGADALAVRIEVSVTWSTRGSFAPVRLVEIVGLPDGLDVGTDALVVVQVIDPTDDGAGVPGATVTLEANKWYWSVDAGSTDEDGCVVARVRSTYAAQATYTAIAKKPGHVGPAWTATAATTIGTLGYGSGTLVNRVTLSYAPSASVRIHLTNEDGTAAATDEEAAGQVLTLLCSGSGTAASEPGWSTALTGAVLEVPAVWPCRYSAYVGADLPPVMTEVQVAGGASADLWVRPGHGIVPAPGAPPEPEPTEEPAPEPTEEPTDQPAPEPGDGAEDGDPAPETGPDAAPTDDPQPELPTSGADG